VAAHHARLFNRKLQHAPARPKAGQVPVLDHLRDEQTAKGVFGTYNALAVIAYLLPSIEAGTAPCQYVPEAERPPATRPAAASAWRRTSRRPPDEDHRRGAPCGAADSVRCVRPLMPGITVRAINVAGTRHAEPPVRLDRPRGAIQIFDCAAAATPASGPVPVAKAGSCSCSERFSRPVDEVILDVPWLPAGWRQRPGWSRLG
jgi:hypothetical protein